MSRFISSASATESVWSRLSTDLLRFIRRRVRDGQTADDLLQEVFLRIHQRIETVHDSDRLIAWVYQIARNAIVDHYRASKRAAGDPLPENEIEDERVPSETDSACVWMDEIVRQLPDDYAVAIRLAEIDGLPQREVAERLSLSLSGAKSRIQRGRELLRQELDRCCKFEFDRRGNHLGCDPKPGRKVCRDCD